MSTHECLKEKEWGGLEVEVQRFKKHCEDSDERGGYRDRVKDLEDEVKGIKKNYILMFVAAMFGGWIGEIIPVKALILQLFT